jgi:glycogen debranching enzyme
MTSDMPGPRFSPREIPFSYYGSWLCVSPVIGNANYADDLHLVSHQQGMHAVLSLRAVASSGCRVDTRIEAVPSRLSWLHESDRIDAVYASADTLRVRGTLLSLRIAAVAPQLTPFSGTYLYRDPVDGSYVFTSYETGRRYRITVLAGAAAVQGEQALGAVVRSLTISPADGASRWEIAIEEYDAGRAPYVPSESFDQATRMAEMAFADFADRIVPWRSHRTPAAEQAAYVLWSATVRPAGFLTRPTVLMSKHWMDKVWSWDHCFNALALADGEADLAWHQFLLPFDHQDSAGALPDSVTHSEVLYNYVKPPIHGWALSTLRQRLTATLTEADLEEIYRRLERWTEYWLSRRAAGSPLPHYYHGNDSGWDNATTFDAARVVESADLAAFLVLQMRELAALAKRIGKPDAGQRWHDESRRLLAPMLSLLWTGERFAARIVRTGELCVSESLLNVMPIVLGGLLPAEIHRALARQVQRHLSEHGPATETLGSPRYSGDGYWRGPIWAPSTVLIEHGLRRAGHVELADEVSRRFRALCETSGFAENFDAATGAGQRDRAYTWTASSYLILAEAAARRDPATGSGCPRRGRS